MVAQGSGIPKLTLYSPLHMKLNTGFSPSLLSISTILNLVVPAEGRRKSVTLVTRCALKKRTTVSVLQVVCPCKVAKLLSTSLESVYHIISVIEHSGK